MQDQQYALYKITSFFFIFSFTNLLKIIVLSMLSDEQLLVLVEHNSQVDIIPKYAKVDFSFIIFGEKTF